MQRYNIFHRTYYNFSGLVSLGPHTLRLRPREDHDLRIESSTLTITPPASLLWHRDVEGNSVAVATFGLPANQLVVESDVVICQYNETPLEFLVADYAINSDPLTSVKIKATPTQSQTSLFTSS
jgi:transglutaminase-like putative cysteine protease